MNDKFAVRGLLEAARQVTIGAFSRRLNDFYSTINQTIVKTNDNSLLYPAPDAALILPPIFPKLILQVLFLGTDDRYIHQDGECNSD